MNFVCSDFCFFGESGSFPCRQDSVPLLLRSQAYSFCSSLASPLISARVAWRSTGRGAATPSPQRGVVQVDAAAGQSLPVGKLQFREDKKNRSVVAPLCCTPCGVMRNRRSGFPGHGAIQIEPDFSFSQARTVYCQFTVPNCGALLLLAEEHCKNFLQKK